MSSADSDIKRYELSIDEGTGRKPRRILRKNLKSSDFGKEFKHDVYLDFISDGVPKEKYTEITVKVGEVIPVNHPPTVSIQGPSTITVKPDTLVRLNAKITDPDEGDQFMVVWEPPATSSGSEGDNYWIEFTTPSNDTDLNFRVIATDNKGAIGYGNVTILVRKEDVPPPPPTKFRIGHCGDTHGEHQAVQLLKEKEQCSFILHSGDITDTESDDDGYIDFVKSLGLTYGENLANAQGNHESPEESGEGAQEDMETAFPKLKENSWLQFYHIKNVIIIIGNTQVSGYSQPDNKVFQFVKDSMVRAKQMVDAGQADWIFFMQHKPEYTMKARHDAEYNWRYNMHPIFDQYGLDISFHGHNHDMQRTLPLIFGGPANAPPIVNNKMKNGAHDFSEPNHGHIVAINGSAVKNTSFSEGINAWTAYADATKNGYTVIEIDGKNLTGKYIEIGSGNVLHEFKITKEGGGPTPIPDAIPVIKPDNIQGTNGQLITVDGSNSQHATTFSWSVSSGLYIQGPTNNPTAQLLLGTTDGTVTLTVTNSEGKTATTAKPVYVTSVPPPPPCPEGQCKDRTTGQCRPIGANETVDIEGYCKASTPPPPPPPDMIDEFGQQWFHANGDQFLIKQSRDETTDDRWSGNVDGVARGYESMMIAKSIGTAGGGEAHFASKLFGGNHSGSGASSQRWYDLGVRDTGEIQLEWEGPHPNNHSFTLPDRCWFIKRLPKGSIENRFIGLKWFVYKLAGPQGSPENGGVLVKMWINDDPIDAATNKVKNENWQLALSFIDGIDVEVIDPQSFSAPDECDIEIRRSDTREHVVWGGGQHIRRLGTYTATAERNLLKTDMHGENLSKQAREERDEINKENRRLAKIDLPKKCEAFDCPKKNVTLVKKGEPTPSSSSKSSSKKQNKKKKNKNKK